MESGGRIDASSDDHVAPTGAILSRPHRAARTHPTTLPNLSASQSGWAHTLKFKIVAIMVAAAVLTALASTEFGLSNTQADLERLLLQSARSDGEGMAAMLGSKLETLQLAVSAVATNVTPQELADPAAMQRLLHDRPALAALFDSVFAARADGRMLARVEKGEASHVLPDIADHEYFCQAMTTHKPAVSKPLLGRVSHTPILVVAAPVRSADGQSVGVIAGDGPGQRLRALASGWQPCRCAQHRDPVGRSPGGVHRHPEDRLGAHPRQPAGDCDGAARGRRAQCLAGGCRRRDGGGAGGRLAGLAADAADLAPARAGRADADRRCAAGCRLAAGER